MHCQLLVGSEWVPLWGAVSAYAIKCSAVLQCRRDRCLPHIMWVMHHGVLYLHILEDSSDWHYRMFIRILHEWVASSYIITSRHRYVQGVGSCLRVTNRTYTQALSWCLTQQHVTASKSIRYHTNLHRHLWMMMMLASTVRQHGQLVPLEDGHAEFSFYLLLLLLIISSRKPDAVKVLGLQQLLHECKWLAASAGWRQSAAESFLYCPRCAADSELPPANLQGSTLKVNWVYVMHYCMYVTQRCWLYICLWHT